LASGFGMAINRILSVFRLFLEVRAAYQDRSIRKRIFRQKTVMQTLKSLKCRRLR
jgi:hypothetical protein